MMAARALFRCEASPAIGGGHVMRCLAFAETLCWAGWRVAFSTGVQSVATVPALGLGRYEVLPPAANDDHPSTRLVVFDHYGLDTRDERGFAAADRLLVVFDDLADRPHDCALLVDPAPGRAAAAYAAQVPQGCRLMLGPRHAMLGARWRAAAPASIARREAGGPARRILVSMGATDPVDATSRVLDALERAGLAAEIDVVLGAAAPHRGAVERRAGAGMRLHVQPEDIVALVAAADLAIGAPGSSSFERAALGVPSLLIPTAANQTQMAEGLGAAGAAALAPAALLADAEALGRVISDLAGDAARLRALSRAGVALGDGRGALRLLAAIAGTRVASDGATLHLRLAESSDADWLLELQRAPATRRFARNPALPTAAEHAAWLARMFADPERLLCVVERNGEAAGMVRLDRLAPQSPRFEVSIAVHPSMHRRGVGGAALALLRRLAPGATLDAAVHAGNAASQALFAAAGYTRIAEGTWRSAP
jgi:UDP-2,4-diacetamido-2,4,6-trideoxy-beta-L-altropyranose hydrolase